jgi:hypothetical protein
MKKFTTLLDFHNYIPNCIICHKPTIISIDGALYAVGDNTRRSSSRARLCLNLHLKDDGFHSNKKAVVFFDFSNKILEGIDLVHRFVPHKTYLKKTCNTCHFKIYTDTFIQSINTKDSLPEARLACEEIHYTMKGGKSISVTKYHKIDKPGYSNESINIMLDNKPLPSSSLEFDKFENIEQLSKRINMIKLFH